MTTKKDKKAPHPAGPAADPVAPAAPSTLAADPVAPAAPSTPAAAHAAAERDIERDPDLSGPDPTDDLDEGELARRDNSDEEAFDELERPRQKGHHGSGSEK